MDALLSDIFNEIAVLLLLSAMVGYIGLQLKQPLIVAFIAVGILVGPTALGWVETNDQIDLLAKLGIALLLFLVGLKLDMHIIRTMGPVALAAGLGQVLFTSIFGFLIALGLGFETIPALYVAAALTFSSTIIIVKLLSDKHELDDLHGRIAIGFLIVQDIVVVLVMIFLTGLGEAGSSGLGHQALTVFINACLFLLFIAFAMRYLLTPLLQQMSQSAELMVLFAIAWAVSLGAAGVYLGLSKEVGAFLAGVSLASTPFKEVIGARLVSLRDFLLLFFFIDLGVGLELSTLTAQLLPAILLSFFVLFGNPIIVMAILGRMGYGKRTGFLAGLTVAQISEFSLILAALGASQGHIQADTVGLITLVGLITISASTYMILYSEQLYTRFAPYLVVFERNIDRPADDDPGGRAQRYSVIVFGLGRLGRAVSAQLASEGYGVLCIDADSELVRGAREEIYDTQYGDIENPEFITSLPTQEVDWIISCVDNNSLNLNLLYALREMSYKGKTAILTPPESIALYEGQHVDEFISPYSYASDHIVGKVLNRFPADNNDPLRE